MKREKQKVEMVERKPTYMTGEDRLTEAVTNEKHFSQRKEKKQENKKLSYQAKYD